MLTYVTVAGVCCLCAKGVGCGVVKPSLAWRQLRYFAGHACRWEQTYLLGTNIVTVAFQFLCWLAWKYTCVFAGSCRCSVRISGGSFLYLCCCLVSRRAACFGAVICCARQSLKRTIDLGEMRVQHACRATLITKRRRQRCALGHTLVAFKASWVCTVVVLKEKSMAKCGCRPMLPVARIPPHFIWLG